MTAATYNMTIEQGTTFERNLFLGQGAQVEITSFADAGAGSTTVAYTGKDPTNGDRIVILQSDLYTGTYTVAAVDGTANTFTIVKAFEEDHTGAIWMDAYVLTGRTYAGMIRTSYTATAQTEDFTTALTDAAGGHLTLSLTKTETTALAAATYVYDIEETVTATAAVERIMRGTATVIAEATK